VKAALVTGGTKGLGFALSMALAEAGFAVVAVYLRDDGQAQRFRDEIARRRLIGRAVRGDIAEPSVADGLAAAPEVAAASELVLVNNAGAPFEPKPLHLLEWNDFEDATRTTVKGSFLCTKALLRALVARNGWVINVLSAAIAGASIPKGFAAYATAKHGLLALTRCLASEYGAQGLRVLSVSPGFMETPLTSSWDPRIRATVARDVRTSDQVAGAIVGLLLRGTAAGREIGHGEDHQL
jgi:NAD(P)-dependent dehydrogenase (short-subunit alcohol dehydrogenase family)